MDVGSLEESVYTPEWKDNQKDSEPIRITLQPLTGGQRVRVMPTRIDGKGDTQIEPDLEKACQYGIKLIENMSTNGVPITTGNELLQCTAPDIDMLIREIGMEVIIRSKRPELKN